MAKDNIETELKLYVPDLDAVAQRLEALGAEISAPRILEKNTRYEDLGGWIASTGTVIRLRQDSRVRLTYKDGERVQGEFGSSRNEVEVEVSDFKKMATILDKLGFHPVLSYEKYRTTFERAGEPGHAVLDETPIGVFLELEGKAGWIDTTAVELGFAPANYILKSYGSLFREYREHHGWHSPNMVFA